MPAHPPVHMLVVPAKLFDYLGSGSTILALAAPGATADLMTETRCGRCFDESDVQGITEYLAELLTNEAFRNLRNDPNSFSRYQTRHLTGRLAAEMAQADADPFNGVKGDDKADMRRVLIVPVPIMLAATVQPGSLVSPARWTNGLANVMTLESKVKSP